MSALTLSRSLIVSASLAGLLVLVVGQTVDAGEPSPTSAPDVRDKVARLVEQLDSKDAAVRDKAAEELIGMDEPARVALESIVGDRSARLSTDQRERIQDILVNGPIVMWERRSGLHESEIELVKVLREGTAGQPNLFENVRRILAIIQEPEVTDEGLALLVKSFWTRVLKDRRERPNQSTHYYEGSGIFALAIEHANAGPQTGRAFSDWVRDWYAPPADSNTRDFRYNMSPDMTSLAPRLLFTDVLTRDAYEQLLRTACEPDPTQQRMWPSSNTELLGPISVIGFCHSRHATSRHLGQLLRALLLRRDVADRQDAAPLSRIGAMQVVAASPGLTEPQARAIAAWVVNSPDRSASQPGSDADATMRWLTNRSIWTVADRSCPASSRPANADDLALRRWRQWLADLGDKPVLARTHQPRYRYASAMLQITDRDSTTVVATAEADIAPGVGTAIRAPRGLTLQWVRIDAHPGYEQWVASAEDAPVGPLCLNVVDLTLGAADHGQIPCRAGDVLAQRCARRSRSYYVPTAQSERIAVRLVADRSKPDTIPSAEQVRDPAWWARRAVESAAWRVRAGAPPWNWACAEGERSWAASDANLSRIREFREAFRSLLDNSPPRVFAWAALQLAVTGGEVDQEALVRILQADDEVAAEWAGEALCYLGRPEGVRLWIDRLKKQGTQSKEYASLMRHWARFEPELRCQLAAELVTAILPAREDRARSAVAEWLLVRRWTGCDFDYEIGGDPAENTKALARFHEWTANPKVPESETPFRGGIRSRVTTRPILAPEGPPTRTIIN